MATEVIHEHTAQGGDNNAIGFFLGIVLLAIIAIFALYYFGAARGFGGLFGTGTPQINVPSQFDVNVNRK